MKASINGMPEVFRALLSGPDIIQLPGCYDVLSAIMLERAGFPAIFLSGYGVAASHLGNPDIGLTTLSETAACSRNTTDRVNVPVVVDADNGYGGEDNVARTVFELESAGAAAMVLEDQVLPKRCGHSAGKQVVPLDQYLRKLDSALKARRTPLCLIARTDSSPIDEAIRRARAFQAAGADCTIIDGLGSLEELKRFAAEVPGPKQVNLVHGGKTPILTAAQLHALGIKVVLYSTPALYLVARALDESMRALRETGDLKSIADRSFSFGSFQELIESRYRGRGEGCK